MHWERLLYIDFLFDLAFSFGYNLQMETSQTLFKHFEVDNGHDVKTI